MQRISLILAGTALLAAPLAAQQREPMGGGMRGLAGMETWSAFAQAFDSAVTAVELTEDQANWITLLMFDVREAHGETLEQVAALRADMRAARENGDREAMRQMMQTMGPLMQQLAPVMEDFDAQVRASLTEPQRQALQSFVERRRPMRRRGD